MKFWIEHPAADGCPVSFKRWVKWKLSEWLGGMAARLEWDALYPNCADCGTPRNRGDHSKCFELPF
jgi:hypothetical protein